MRETPDGGVDNDADHPDFFGIFAKAINFPFGGAEQMAKVRDAMFQVENFYQTHPPTVPLDII